VEETKLAGGNDGESDEHGRRQYGMGGIEFDKRTGRYRLRFRSSGRSLTFATREEAVATRKAIAKAREPTLGITLRQWGEIWLSTYDFGKAIPATWRSLVCRAPFIDWPLTSLTSGDVAGWAEDLLSMPATRSVLRDGKRSTVMLDRPISREHAKNGLSALRSCLDAAKNRKPQLLTANPAADVALPKPKGRNGRTRTKKERRNPIKLDFMPQDDCARVFFCAHCEAKTGVPRNDLEQLVRCEHFPFFYRVAHSVSIMQGLREGEIASQRWERIFWIDSKDWTGHTWLICSSWDGDTKNGQDRTQALIPMAARLLHRWWQFKGCPEQGLLFCTADAASKRPLGELARFVSQHPHHTNHDLVREAERHGLALSLRRVETLRSEARRRAERKRNQADQMFAQGYDFGWFDSPWNDLDGVRHVRPGWRTKLGISTQTRVHDHRDTAATHLLSGTWGPKWSLQMVSDFLGHSDIKVTEQRYAHLTTEAKTAAAAGVDPTRPSPTPQRVSPAKIARTLPTAVWMPPELSLGNQWAPEVGLEPTANRLTGLGASQESAHLEPNTGIVRAISAETAELARRLLDSASKGEPLLGNALQLAGTILDAVAEQKPAADSERKSANSARNRQTLRLVT
jgi:integrase